jgi:exodeoxyribonuclease III
VGIVKLLSRNLAGRLRRIPQQVDMLARRTPDLVTLQGVTQPVLLWLRTLLAKCGLIHQADSFELAPCPATLTGPRRYGLLIASRFPLYAWEPGRFSIPWPERMRSVDMAAPCGPLEVHTTHIPPTRRDQWTGSRSRCRRACTPDLPTRRQSHACSAAISTRRKMKKGLAHLS